MLQSVPANKCLILVSFCKITWNLRKTLNGFVRVPDQRVSMQQTERMNGISNKKNQQFPVSTTDSPEKDEKTLSNNWIAGHCASVMPECPSPKHSEFGACSSDG